MEVDAKPETESVPKYGMACIALSKLARTTMNVSASKKDYPGDAEVERLMAEMICNMNRTQGHIGIDTFRAYDEDTDDNWKMYYHIIQMSSEGAKKMGGMAAVMAMTQASQEGWNLPEVMADLQVMIVLEDRTDRNGVTIKWLPPDKVEQAKSSDALVYKDGYGKTAQPWVVVPAWRMFAGLPDMNVHDVNAMQRNVEKEMLDEVIGIASQAGVSEKPPVAAPKPDPVEEAPKKVKTEHPPPVD